VTSKYPFDDWLDGRVWLLRERLDFTCQLESMSSQVYLAARRAEMSCATRIVVIDWNDPLQPQYGILVQAYPHGSTWKPNLVNTNLLQIKSQGKLTNKR
jgi:hypothetical protein